MDNRRLPLPNAACLWVLICAAAPAVASQAAPAKQATPEDPGTRSITLPGSLSTPTNPRPGRPPVAALEPQPGASSFTPGVVAASLELAPAAGEGETERHYKTAILALKDDNLPIAAEEMEEAAHLSPDNALVLYGLAVIQARDQHPELALPSIEKALKLGLPDKKSAQAEDLIASIRYAIKKDEAEQKSVTPAKLWGSYDVPLEDPSQESQDLPGKTIFKTRLPVSREMFLWTIESDSTIRGHWLEKYTETEQTSFANSKRRDPEPKVTNEEHWWLLSILINSDGSLDGSRIETCSRHPGQACEHGEGERGRVVTFKGRLEQNGDLTIVPDDVKGEVTLKKKSRVTSVPPPDVRIRLD